MIRIFLDLDDVCADWITHAMFLTNEPVTYGMRLSDTAYERLKSEQRFYRDLPLKEGAEELVQTCQAYVSKRTVESLAFLTALPSLNDVPYAAHDKVHWAHRHFPGIPVFFGPYSEDKHTHVRYPGDILIDDRVSNCEEWQQAGGISHIYRNWPSCQEFLTNTLGPL